MLTDYINMQADIKFDNTSSDAGIIISYVTSASDDACHTAVGQATMWRGEEIFSVGPGKSTSFFF